MSKIEKIVTSGSTTENADTYVGKRGEITLNPDNLTLSVHNGFQPYSIGPLYFGGTWSEGATSRSGAFGFAPNSYTFLTGPTSGPNTVFALPPATNAGTVIYVMMAGSSVGVPVSIWANGSDTINGVANDPVTYSPASTGITTAPLIFVCSAIGAWWTNGILD